MCEGLFKGIPDEPTTTATIETEFCEIFSCEICVAGEDDMAGVGVIVDWRSMLRRSTPIPDGQCSTGSTAGPGEAAEAKDAAEAVQVDDRVGAGDLCARTILGEGHFRRPVDNVPRSSWLTTKKRLAFGD